MLSRRGKPKPYNQFTTMKYSAIAKDLKFYVSLFLGFTLLVIGCFIEPPGVISGSVLMGGGMIFCITAGLIGVDLSKVIKEFRFLQAGIALTEDEKQEIKTDMINKMKEE